MREMPRNCFVVVVVVVVVVLPEPVSFVVIIVVVSLINYIDSAVEFRFDSLKSISVSASCEPNTYQDKKSDVYLV